MASFRSGILLSFATFAITVNVVGCGGSNLPSAPAATSNAAASPASNVPPAQPVAANPAQPSAPHAPAPVAPGAAAMPGTPNPAMAGMQSSAVPGAGSSAMMSNPAQMALAPNNPNMSVPQDPMAAMKGGSGAPGAMGQSGSSAMSGPNSNPSKSGKPNIPAIRTVGSAPPGVNPVARGPATGSSGQSGPGSQGGPAGPGGAANNITPGSAEDVLFRFCTAVADDDTAVASEYVSSKAKGMVGKLRDGDLSEEQIEEIVEAINPVTDLQPNPNSTSTTRTFWNKKNQVLTFTVRKEEETFKIMELKVSKPKQRQNF